MAFRSAGHGFSVDYKAAAKLMDDLSKGLVDIEPKVRKKGFVKAARAALKPMHQNVRRKIPKSKNKDPRQPDGSGTMRKSIKLRTRKRSRRSAGMQVISRGDFYKGPHFYYAFHEFGYHIGKREGWMRQGGSWAGIGSKGDKRKYVPGKHYMEDTFDAGWKRAMDAAIDGTMKEIDKALLGAFFKGEL